VIMKEQQNATVASEGNWSLFGFTLKVPELRLTIYRKQSVLQEKNEGEDKARESHSQEKKPIEAIVK